jgi:polyisoprenoid-binding protein YceI
MASTPLKEPPAVAASRRWAVDPRRSTVEFRVPTFWGLSTVVGHFDHFEGAYGRDDDDVPTIDLTIDADSLDTGNETLTGICARSASSTSPSTRRSASARP